MQSSSRNVRNDAIQHRLEFFRMRCAERCLGTSLGLTRGSAPRANLAGAWCDVGCDVAGPRICFNNSLNSSAWIIQNA